MDLDTGVVGLSVARLRRKPFIYHCLDPYHAALPQGWPPFMADLARWMEDAVISSADLFVITDLKRLPQHEGARPRQVVELANVPLPELAELTEAPHEGFIVGYIGSQVPGRNLETTIDAVAELQAEGVSLVMGGFGPLAEEMAARAQGQSNVRFLSWVPAEELYPLERTFDLFVYVTDRENPAYRWVSPNKLFESMALGRPIIVGEGTLAAERVAAAGNGIAIPYGDKAALKGAILALKNDPTLARQMGERGRVEFEGNWRPEVMEARLLGAYGAVVKGER
jgi:glycosyltransferase involved in cell wall biosynthesis